MFPRHGNHGDLLTSRSRRNGSGIAWTRTGADLCRSASKHCRNVVELAEVGGEDVGTGRKILHNFVRLQLVLMQWWWIEGQGEVGGKIYLPRGNG